MQVGLILNFKHARLEWERIVLTREPRSNADESGSGIANADLFAPPQPP